jgi:hypothetical protein
MLRQKLELPLHRDAAAALTVAYETLKQASLSRGESRTDYQLKQEVTRIYHEFIAVTDPSTGNRDNQCCEARPEMAAPSPVQRKNWATARAVRLFPSAMDESGSGGLTHQNQPFHPELAELAVIFGCSRGGGRLFSQPATPLDSIYFFRFDLSSHP